MKERIRSHKYLLLVLILSIIPLASLFFTNDSPHTSDGAMHLVRIGAYYKEITSGQFPVRWASDLNYGYGTPLFNFFHPLPYVFSLPFVALGFGLVGTLKILFLLSFILSGIFMYLFAKAFFEDEFTAFFVTIFYQFAPYRLVEIIVRGGAGSAFSYSFFPLVLYGIVMFNKTKRYRYAFITILSTALLIFSHNMLGFLFCTLSGLFVLFFAKSMRMKLMSFFLLGAGVLLSATFLLPVLLEYRYTYGYLFTKDLFRNHFVDLYKFFVPNFFDDQKLRVAEVSVQFGLFHTIGLLLAVIYLIRKIKNKKHKTLFLFSLLIILVSVFLMTPFSKPLWEHLPLLRSFQYPWRILAAVTFATSLLSVSYLVFIKNRTIQGLILLLMIIATLYYWKPPQGFVSINEAEYWNYPLSTNYYGEVDTIWAAGPAGSYPKKRVDVIGGKATIQNFQKQAAQQHFTLRAETDAQIVSRTQFFPGWKVYVDGKNTQVDFQDQNWRGLITFRVPKGEHDVDIVFTQSFYQRLGNWLTVITFIGIIGGLFVFRKKKLL